MFPVPFNRDQGDFIQLWLFCAAWLGLQGAAYGSFGGLEIQSNKEIITQCKWFQAVSNPNRTSFFGWLEYLDQRKVGLSFSSLEKAERGKLRNYFKGSFKRETFLRTQKSKLPTQKMSKIVC